jgi:hypothetical protein
MPSKTKPSQRSDKTIARFERKPISYTYAVTAYVELDADDLVPLDELLEELNAAFESRTGHRVHESLLQVL